MANKKNSRRTRKEKKQASKRRKNKYQRSKPVTSVIKTKKAKEAVTSKKPQPSSLVDQSEKWFWHDARHSFLATLFVVILLLLAWYLI